MAERFDDILNECIDRLLRGESLEQCLQRYPEQSAQLEPLLRVAAAASRAASVEPRPEFKAQLRYQIQSHLGARKQKAQSKRLSFFGWVPRWAAVAASVLLIVLVAGTGTVAASVNSLPGDPLYSVKLATEEVQLAFTFSDTAKTELLAKFAGRRAEEMARIAEKGDPQKVQELSTRLEGVLGRIEGLAGAIKQGDVGDGAQVTEMRRALARYAVRDIGSLDRAEVDAPDVSRPDVTRARETVVQGYLAALEALNSGANR